MIKRKQLIEQTLKVLTDNSVDIDDGILRLLKSSLATEMVKEKNSTDSVYCEVLMSSSESDQLIDALFDLEADFAPKGLGYGSEEDLCRERSARDVAAIINTWNADND